jgi:hypothetical protein
LLKEKFMKKYLMALAISVLMFSGCVTTGAVKPVVQVKAPTPVTESKEYKALQVQVIKLATQVSQEQAKVKAESKAKTGARFYMFLFFVAAILAVIYPASKAVVFVRTVLNKVLAFVVALVHRPGVQSAERSFVEKVVDFFKGIYVAVESKIKKIFKK